MTIQARDISLALSGRAVLRSVDLRADTGMLLGLIGPNGSGKTSLLRVLAGLAKGYSGTVTLDGIDLKAMARGPLARHLGYLPQARELNWNLPVEDVVALGRLPHGGAVPDDVYATRRAMTALNIAHLAGRTVADLSGGERARVLAARVVAQSTPVLLADEPSSGLDPAQELFLFDLLRRMTRAGKTVVVAVHNLSLAARFCDGLTLLHEGRVLIDGPPRRVLASGPIAEAYGLVAHYTEHRGIPQVVPLGPASTHS